MWLPTTDYDQYTINVPVGGTITVLPNQVLSGDIPINETTYPTAFGAGVSGQALAQRQGYIIKRVVGELFVEHAGGESGPPGSAFPGRIAVAAGFLVDRVDNTGALLNSTSWNPFAEDARQRRWLWYRTWRLEFATQNGVYNDGSGFVVDFGNSSYGGVGTLPASNVGYTTALANHRVDFKPKAYVGYEMRLFCMLGVSIIGTYATASINALARFTQNLRVYGVPTRR